VVVLIAQAAGRTSTAKAFAAEKRRLRARPTLTKDQGRAASAT